MQWAADDPGTPAASPSTAPSALFSSIRARSFRTSIGIGLLMSWAASATGEVQLRPGGSIEFGFDTYAQIYRLTDFVDGSLAGSLRDTTDVFTEARLAAELGMRTQGERWSTDLRARISSGTESQRGRAGFDLGYRGGRDRVDIDLEFEGRRFSEDTDFTLSSDVGEGRLRARWSRMVRDGWALGLRTRAETVHYEQRSIYELDSRRLDAALTTELRRGFDQWLEIEAGAGRRSIPDSTSISYDRWFATAQYHREIDSRWRLALTHFLERRVYDDPGQRSPFTDVTLEPDLRLRLDERWELRWTSTLEWIDFDRGSDVYFDMFLGQTGLALVRRSGWLEIAVEPRSNWLRTPAGVEDEYGQLSVLTRIDWFGTGRWWFSASVEGGHRDYRSPGADELELFSDYWFLRSTLLASLRLSEGLSLDGFLSDEPEAHRRSADDARLTLLNLNLRWRF